MCAIKDDQSVVIDRQLNKAKSHAPSGPRIPCRPVRLVATQKRSRVVHLPKRFPICWSEQILQALNHKKAAPNRLDSSRVGIELSVDIR
jgi:hypothetical protein